MPNPRCIINTSKPPQELTNLIKSRDDIDTVHFYLDLKNSSSGLFIVDIIREIVENSKNISKGVDSSYLQSVLYTISCWKYWSKIVNKKIKIFIITDKGKSAYHKNINPLYKDNRKISNVMLPYAEESEEIIFKNNNLISDICIKLPDVHYISLEFLESDFIPYYLITRKFKEEKNIFHIIGSNDKDHYQALLLDNTIMFTKKSSNFKIFDKSTILLDYLKIKDNNDIDEKQKALTLIKNIDPHYISVLMAICGDTVDNVFGIKGIGAKTAFKIFNNDKIIKAIFGNSLGELLERVYNGDNIIINNPDITLLDKKYHYLVTEENNKIITDSFKQISYELLCRWLEKRDTITKIDHLNKIDSKLNKVLIENDIKEILVKMISSLEDIQLDPLSLEYLF